MQYIFKSTLKEALRSTNLLPLLVFFSSPSSLHYKFKFSHLCDFISQSGWWQAKWIFLWNTMFVTVFKLNRKFSFRLNHNKFMMNFYHQIYLVSNEMLIFLSAAHFVPVYEPQMNKKKNSNIGQDWWSWSTISRNAF